MNRAKLDSFNSVESRNSLLSRTEREGPKLSSRKSRRITKRILLLGSGQVGKTSLATRFLFDYFPESPTHSLDENYRKIVKYNKKNIELVVTDTPPVDDFTFMVPQKYSYGVSGYVFMYSVENKNSFEMINKLRKKLFNLNGRHLPSLLIANKIDLSSQRKIRPDEGQMAANLWSIPFMELSVKNDSQVKIEKCFTKLIQKILKEESPEEKTRLCRCFNKLGKLNEKQINIILSSFQCLTISTLILGLIFLLFGAITTLISPAFINNNGVILFVLLAIGLMLILISVFGFFGIKYQNIEYLKIFLVLSPVITIVEVIAICLIYSFRDDNPTNSDLDKKYIGRFNSWIKGFLITAITLQFLLFMGALLSKYLITKKRELDFKKLNQINV